MAKSPLKPTEVELSILRVLWGRGRPLTVRDVHASLSKDKDTAYTTVLKMLTIMTDKGLVCRDESERSHTFVPAHSEARVQASMLRDFLKRAFAGSPLSLMQRALDERLASEQDLAEMEKLIARARAKRKDRQ